MTEPTYLTVTIAGCVVSFGAIEFLPQRARGYAAALGLLFSLAFIGGVIHHIAQ